MIGLTIEPLNDRADLEACALLMAGSEHWITPGRSAEDRIFRVRERLGYEIVGEPATYLVAGHAEILLRKTRGPLSTFTPAAGA